MSFTWTLTTSVDVEADIREEIEAHLDAAVADLVAAGMEPDEARREALARFGNVDRIVGACRTVKLEERIMLQRALLALVAILSIAVVVQAYQLHESQARTNQALAEVRHDFNAAATRIEEALLFVEVPFDSTKAPRDDDSPGATNTPEEIAARFKWDPTYGPAERLELLYQMVERVDAGALHMLLLAAEDPDLFVRMAAARALADVDHPDSIAALEHLVRTDRQPAVRTAAEEALKRLRSAEDPTDPDPFFLGNPSETDTPPEEEPDLLDHVWQGEPLTWDAKLTNAERFEAAHDLYAHGDAGIEPLMEAAGDPDVFVRLTAVRFLGELKAFEALPIVEELSKLDPHEVVREEAAEALRKIKD